MVAGQLAHPRVEAARAVRKENFALADVTGVDEQVSRCRVRRVVLEPDVGPMVAERDPRRLSAPFAVNQR